MTAASRMESEILKYEKEGNHAKNNSPSYSKLCHEYLLATS